MELFLLYLITRLTDLKAGLHSLELIAGLLCAVVILVRIINELFTDADIKDMPAEDASSNKDVYIYRGIKRTSLHGIKLFLPVFVVVFVVNLFLPTTRDAVVIAGGYGLVEAVKNERVQRLFAKSTNVASQWLDEQLGSDDKKEEQTEDASKAKDKTNASASASAASSASDADSDSEKPSK